MTNQESGKYIAQKFSHHLSTLLESIYMATVEPNKPLNDFEIGVMEEAQQTYCKSANVSYFITKIENHLKKQQSLEK